EPAGGAFDSEIELAREPYEARDCRGRRRARQALEVTLVGAGRACIEAGQAQRRGDREEERGEPAEPPPELAVIRDALDAPLVDDDRRRDAEGDHVAQAVVLLAEIALRVGPARDAPVQAVEQHGDEDRDAGAREVAVDGRDDRVKAAEERAGGEHVREPIHAAGGILRGRYIAGFVVLGAHGMGARSWTHDIVRRAARTTDAADRVRSQVESPPCSFVPALADRGRACFSRPPAGSAARRAARAGTR